jgi:hypothetical protein
MTLILYFCLSYSFLTKLSHSKNEKLKSWIYKRVSLSSYLHHKINNQEIISFRTYSLRKYEKKASLDDYETFDDNRIKKSLKSSLRERRNNKRVSELEKAKSKKVLESSTSSYNLTAIHNNDIISAINITNIYPNHMLESIPIYNSYVSFLSFYNLFPESNLSEIFDSNSYFRNELRTAARYDFSMNTIVSNDENIITIKEINDPR